MYRFVRSLIIILMLVVSLANALGFRLYGAADASWLLSQINCLRQSVGAAPLTVNPSLATSATQHSTYLANNNDWSDFHVEPDGSTPQSRTQAAGYTGYVGENVV